MTERIECPQQLLEKLRPAQEQVNRLQAEIQAALFGAKIALGVPDDWQWDGSGWTKSQSDIMSGDNST